MKMFAMAGVLAFGVAAAAAQQGMGDDKNDKNRKDEKVVVEGKPETAAMPALPEPDSATDHVLSVGAQKIAYKAVAGTITVGYNDAFDSMLGLDGRLLADAAMNAPDAAKPEEAPATARMFYTAYFKKDAPAGTRP